MGGTPLSTDPHAEQKRAAKGRAFPQLLQKPDIIESPSGSTPATMSYVTLPEKVPSLLFAVGGLDQLASDLALGGIGTGADDCLIFAHGERPLSIEVARLACGHERTPLQLGP